MLDDRTEKPISESYWVVPGQFLAGEYPALFDETLTRKRIGALLKAGFDRFIDLTRQNETVPYENILTDEANAYGVKILHQRFSIGDMGLPNTAQMNLILDTIDSHLQAGHRIYLHCWGGIGRTGTTVGCYLVRQGKSGEEALRQLAAWWHNVPKSRYHPTSPETGQQMDFILDWAKYDHKKWK